MSLSNYLLILIVLSIASGHITHIMVTAVIFDGLRKRIRAKAAVIDGFWVYFSKGYHCQLCSGVWYASIISLCWTIAVHAFRPDLWNSLSGRDFGGLNAFAWISLYLVQAFFIAAIGHLFREIVGLIEDQRTREEEEAELLTKECELMGGKSELSDTTCEEA